LLVPPFRAADEQRDAFEPDSAFLVEDLRAGGSGDVKAAIGIEATAVTAGALPFAKPPSCFVTLPSGAA
jgi:hypothetical protein